MSLSRQRTTAIVGKDLREFRRNRSLVASMTIVPALFCVQPAVSVFAIDPSASGGLSQEHVLVYMLGIPALTPAFVAAYSIVGERVQGTLEPILTTPIRRSELLLGKAFAALLPSVLMAYAVFGVFLLLIAAFAQPGVAAAIVRPIDLIVQLVFTPLIAGWSIWIATAISTRASDVRVAQQLSALASLPSIAVTTLIAFNVIEASPATAVIAGAALLVLNGIGWLVTSALVDRERLVAG